MTMPLRVEVRSQRAEPWDNLTEKQGQGSGRKDRGKKHNKRRTIGSSRYKKANGAAVASTTQQVKCRKQCSKGCVGYTQQIASKAHQWLVKPAHGWQGVLLRLLQLKQRQLGQAPTVQRACG